VEYLRTFGIGEDSHSWNRPKVIGNFTAIVAEGGCKPRGLTQNFSPQGYHSTIDDAIVNYPDKIFSRTQSLLEEE